MQFWQMKTRQTGSTCTTIEQLNSDITPLFDRGDPDSFLDHISFSSCAFGFQARGLQWMLLCKRFGDLLDSSFAACLTQAHLLFCADIIGVLPGQAADHARHAGLQLPWTSLAKRPEHVIDVSAEQFDNLWFLPPSCRLRIKLS